MNNCNWSNKQSGRYFISLTNELAKNGVYDLVSIKNIFDSVNRCNLADLVSDSGVDEATAFLYTLNIGHYENKSKSFRSKRYRVETMNALLMVLEMDFIREVYGLQGAGSLHSEKRRQLVNHFQQETNRECYDTRLRHSLFRDLNEVNEDSDLRISLDYVLPISRRRSIILERNGKCGDNDAGLSHKVGEADSEAERLALILPRRTELNDDGELFGRVKEELGHMAHLQMRTKLVESRLYAVSVDSGANLEFARELLTACRRREPDSGRPGRLAGDSAAGSASLTGRLLSGLQRDLRKVSGQDKHTRIYVDYLHPRSTTKVVMVERKIAGEDGISWALLLTQPGGGGGGHTPAQVNIDDETKQELKKLKIKTKIVDEKLYRESIRVKQNLKFVRQLLRETVGR